MNPFAVSLLCLFGTAGGQLLFASSAKALRAAPPGIPWNAVWTLGGALATYGLTTVLWIWVLTRLELSRVYPIMALSFVLVPVASTLLYHTPLQPRVLFGAAIITVGIAVSVVGVR